MKKTMIRYGLMLLIFDFGLSQTFAQGKQQNAGELERAYLVQTLVKIADPVLSALAKNELKAVMPVEAKNDGRKNYTHLEAFGRLYAGMAPWLELGPDDTKEGKLREKYIDLTIKSLTNACNPKAADFMNFDGGGQSLVDAAFLAQGLLRSPKQVWEKLTPASKNNVIAALKSTRVITPSYSNWLLFSAEIEAALLKFDGKCDRMRIDYAIKSHMLWYKGDGAYGDGPSFHWDYYNSFVIQPMLLDVAKVLMEVDQKNVGLTSSYALILKRAQRYAAVQERMISPEGTYPPIGRSLAYRFGAFQVLSQIALAKALPAELKPQQVRAALYTIIKRQADVKTMYDDKGWLTIGIYGRQPNIGESYISTGSLYLCSQAFLILGLPETADFWQGNDQDWTSVKVWKGIDIPAEHAID